MSKYPKPDSDVNFAELENKILNYWAENKSFDKSVTSRPATDENKQNNEFIFYDGPPFANGLPHYGHLLTGFIKDCYARYQTIKGKKVERRFGWDCHGLPAEMQAEKDLNLSGRKSIEDYGIDKFNQHCRQSVMKYTRQWQDYVTRQARWVDFDNDYKTMDKSFMESVIWAFKALYDKGLVYESMRVMPYSWACQTPLSNFETRLDNSYRERADKSVTVSFKLDDKPASLPSGYSEYRVLGWTTTPWTLISNLALAVGPEIKYTAIEKDNICYIVGAFALDKHKQMLEAEDSRIPVEFAGNELVGISYSPIFDYFASHPNAFKILSGDFVEEGEGTGIVHLSPGFGEDDQLLCDHHNIELVCPVDSAGKFTGEVPDFEGQLVFDAIDPIIKKLKHLGNWIKTEQYIHNYPHCWRTDTPLIYKAVPSWYVEVTKFRDRMVELNQEINWIPGHIKDGLFGKWLENAKDWSISRNRYWGAPIPVWKSDDPNYPRIDVYGSAAELERDFGVEVTDLHRPYIDQLTRPNPDDPTGKSVMRRVSDIFDCWFESGSMPFAQAHYPFENKEWFENHFPADFIVEYVSQTRGWFYTLMVLSTALFDRPPFLNCICHGVILDINGQKLSKRLQNYPDPLKLFETYGADAVRYTMLSSNVVKGEELLIDKDGHMVKEALRLYIKPIWNSYNFFTLYASADDILAKFDYSSDNILDRYILSKLKSHIQQIDKSLDAYNTGDAYKAVTDFFEVLNNWYIRRSRLRFWKSDIDADKQNAYNTLYVCIEAMSRAMSPILPLISEEIYLGMHTPDSEGKESVHLDYFPDLSGISDESELVRKMDLARGICSTSLYMRNKENIRVRQPLRSLYIIGENSNEVSSLEELIKDEINVRELHYIQDISGYAEYKLDLNFPVLGKRLAGEMKSIIPEAKKGNWQRLDNGNISIKGIEIYPEEFSLSLIPRQDKGAEALPDHKNLVQLDMEIDEELELEGITRDIVRLVQQTRKNADYHVSDRIKLKIDSDDQKINASISRFGDYLGVQTLSEIDNNLAADYSEELQLGSSKIRISIAKI
jgi:isoleucyl-tRNA synthetase